MLRQRSKPVTVRLCSDTPVTLSIDRRFCTTVERTNRTRLQHVPTTELGNSHVRDAYAGVRYTLNNNNNNRSNAVDSKSSIPRTLSPVPIIEFPTVASSSRTNSGFPAGPSYFQLTPRSTVHIVSRPLTWYCDINFSWVYFSSVGTDRRLRCGFRRRRRR